MKVLSSITHEGSQNKKIMSGLVTLTYFIQTKVSGEGGS